MNFGSAFICKFFTSSNIPRIPISVACSYHFQYDFFFWKFVCVSGKYTYLDALHRAFVVLCTANPGLVFILVLPFAWLIALSELVDVHTKIAAANSVVLVDRTAKGYAAGVDVAHRQETALFRINCKERCEGESNVAIVTIQLFDEADKAHALRLKEWKATLHSDKILDRTKTMINMQWTLVHFFLVLKNANSSFPSSNPILLFVEFFKSYAIQRWKPCSIWFRNKEAMSFPEVSSEKHSSYRNPLL